MWKKEHYKIACTSIIISSRKLLASKTPKTRQFFVVIYKGNHIKYMETWACIKSAKRFRSDFLITSAVDNWFIDNLFNISLSPPIIQNRSDSIFSSYSICDVLRDLVPFVQFKKCEKHPLRSITFSKVAGFLYNLKNVKNTHGGMLLLVNW